MIVWLKHNSYRTNQLIVVIIDKGFYTTKRINASLGNQTGQFQIIIVIDRTKDCQLKKTANAIL